MKNYVKIHALTIILCLCYTHITKTASESWLSEQSATATPVQRYGLAALTEYVALPNENRLNPYITMAGGPILGALLTQQSRNTSQSSSLSSYLIAAGKEALRVLGAQHISEILSQTDLEKFTSDMMNEKRSDMLDNWKQQALLIFNDTLTPEQKTLIDRSYNLGLIKDILENRISPTDKEELLGTTFEAWQKWLTHLDSDQKRIQFIQKEIDRYFSKEQGLNDIADFIKDYSRNLDRDAFTTRETLKLLLNNNSNKQEEITAIRESDLYKKWSIFWPKIILYPENRHWNWEENKEYLLKKLRSLDNFLSAEQYNAFIARVENTPSQDFNNLKQILYDMYHLNIPQLQRERNNLLEHLSNWLRNSIEKLQADIADNPHYRNNNKKLSLIKIQARVIALLRAHISNIINPNPSIKKIMPDEIEKDANEILLPPSVIITPPLPTVA